MTISAQIAVYPLRQQRLTPAIDAVALTAKGLAPQIGPTPRGYRLSLVPTGKAPESRGASETGVGRYFSRPPAPSRGSAVAVQKPRRAGPGYTLGNTTSRAPQLRPHRTTSIPPWTPFTPPTHPQP